ncbi:hypothetical protein GWI33_005470 [Rhynchophorus ferrugineus]|uniref:Uncharacterized protein n=1 Tax=Rhynchophorus ferrugineus TaxID=354439 RepID=A0A834IHE7_RHYFE|nr:hypothetical protein GWI33_005470 [Rhynchophorus ferrugineus]
MSDAISGTVLLYGMVAVLAKRDTYRSSREHGERYRQVFQCPERRRTILRIDHVDGCQKMDNLYKITDESTKQ